MKIVAINGSPRKNGNTALLLDTVRKEVEAAGVEFQVFQPGPNVHPCMACYNCLDTGSLAASGMTMASTTSSPPASRPTASCWPPRYTTAVCPAA